MVWNSLDSQIGHGCTAHQHTEVTQALSVSVWGLDYGEARRSSSNGTQESDRFSTRVAERV